MIIWDWLFIVLGICDLIGLLVGMRYYLRNPGARMGPIASMYAGGALVIYYARRWEHMYKWPVVANAVLWAIVALLSLGIILWLFGRVEEGQ